MSIADKLTTIAENEQKVYDTGYNIGNSDGYYRGYQLGLDDGYNEGYASGDVNGYERGHTDGESVGYDKGVVDGKQAEYDAFWDAYQQYGERTNYTLAFAGGNDAKELANNVWNDNNFYPKYDITLYTSTFNRCYVTNLKQRLIDCGVKISGGSTIWYYTFYKSKITHIPDISMIEANNIQHAFNGCTNLVSIDGLKVTETCSFTSAFANCTALEHVIFYGTIGSNSLNLQWSDLDYESLTSIKNILADKSTDTSGTSWVVTLGSNNKAKYTETDLEEIGAKGWTIK